MEMDQFRVPVRIVERPGFPVREIYGASEALDFLLAWPGKKGAPYHAAVDGCFAVAVDVETSDKAQKTFRRFARISGILSGDMIWQPGSRRARQSGPRRI